MAAKYRLHTLGIARVGPTPRFESYTRWLERGHHGAMEYLARGLEERADPRHRLAGARSAVVLTLDHHHTRPADPGGRTGKVARYAWGRDYHNILDKRLRKLKRDLREEGVNVWGGADTAPILERAWAEAAGLGFIGKNTLLIQPARTSWFHLAVLFLDAELAPDTPTGRDHCGSCTRCLDDCPTDAFVGPRELDARRCISYWTIEAQGLPPRELRHGFGRWVFGCDACQETCPHNAAAPVPEQDDMLPRFAWLDLDELIRAPDEQLMQRFLGTPLRRPKAHGLKRNALLALANLQDSGAVPSARLALEHPHPDVRAAAVWCLRELEEPGSIPISDPDPQVQAEIVGAP